MAIENELKARLQHAVIGEGTTTINSVPKKGEIIFNSDLTNFRVGDGENREGTEIPKTYNDLPDFIENVVLPIASSDTLGGIKIGYTANSNNYPVQLGSNTGDTGTASRAYVNVPWTDTNTRYQFYLNGSRTYNSDSTGDNLSSPDGTALGIYAPINGGTSSGQLLISQGSGNPFSASAPTWANLGDGLTLDTTSNTSKVKLKPAEIYDSSNSEIGGIKVGGVAGTAVNANTADENPHRRYAVLRDSNNLAYVNVPWVSSSYTLPTASSGILGGLLVSSDVDADVGYENLDSAVAVPVFYGTVNSMYTRKKDDPDYDTDSPVSVVTHYINVRDVLNGIITDQEMAIKTKQFIEWLLNNDPAKVWPWWQQ